MVLTTEPRGLWGEIPDPALASAARGAFFFFGPFLCPFGDITPGAVNTARGSRPAALACERKAFRAATPDAIGYVV